MAVKLNLLPSELSVSKNLGNFLKTVRALGVIGVAAFLIFAVGVGAFFIFSTFSLNSLNASVDELKTQVSAQQNSEQRIVLLKDRLDKAGSALNLHGSLPNLTTLEPYLSTLSSSAYINEMNLSSTTVSLSMSLQNTSDVTSLLGSFQTSNVFKSSGLTAFSLSSKNGYIMEIDAANK